MARRLVPIGRIQTAGDVSLSTLITNPSSSRSAVDGRIRAVAPAIIAENGTVTAAVVAAVSSAVAGMEIVQVANNADFTSTASWKRTETFTPYSDTYSDTYTSSTGPVLSTSVFPQVVDGKIDKSLIPDLGYVTAPEVPALVNAALADGRPAWMPATRTFDARRGTWNLTPANTKGWKVAQARMKAGLGAGVIQVVADSLGHLGGPPWNVGSWPGRMRKELVKEFGDGGSGIANLWNLIPLTSHTASSSSEDNRWTYVNAATGTSNLTAYAGGSFRASMVKITDPARDSYLEFTNGGEPFNEVWLYGINTTTRSTISVDGVDMSWAKDANDNAGAAVPVLAGYASGQRVSKITLAMGVHTIRIYGTSTGVVLGGAEGRIVGSNLIVHNSSKSSATLNGLGVSDGAPATGVDSYGWTLDMLKADLVLFALHINDWQGHRPLDLFVADVVAATARAQANGSTVIWTLSPQPDYSIYPPTGGNAPAYTEYLRSIYAAAMSADVPVIDNAYIWRDYATMADLFNDGLHQNNLGRQYIANTHVAILKE